jgi:8-oxo-dGTP diphosphatase
VEYGLSGFAMVDERFTVSELRRVHQAVRNVELDPSNFRKRVNRWVCEGLVEELDAMRATATRPARLFRLR